MAKVRKRAVVNKKAPKQKISSTNNLFLNTRKCKVLIKRININDNYSSNSHAKSNLQNSTTNMEKSRFPKPKNRVKKLNDALDCSALTSCTKNVKLTASNKRINNNNNNAQEKQTSILINSCMKKNCRVVIKRLSETQILSNLDKTKNHPKRTAEVTSTETLKTPKKSSSATSIKKNEIKKSKRIKNLCSKANDSEISIFAPPKNSTFFEQTSHDKNKYEANKKNVVKSLAEKPTKNINKILTRNLLQRDVIIEQILNDKLDDNENDILPNINKIPIKENATQHKFFHKNVDTANNASTTTITTTQTTSTSIDQKNKKIYNKYRKSLSKRKSSIYDFLSQSQSDSDCDPAADVVKKLIATGKVSVATAVRGHGKPIIKRLNRNKAKVTKKVITKNCLMQQQKQQNQKHDLENCDTQNKQKQQKSAKLPVIREPTIEEDDDDNFEHIHENNDNVNKQLSSALTENVQTTTTRTMLSPSKGYNSEQQQRRKSFKGNESAFSALARSVLMKNNFNNYNKTNNMISPKSTEAALKFISTPINKKQKPPANSSTNLSPHLSPVMKKPTTPTLIDRTSFRIPDETRVPVVFYFNCSSNNLPTYSSDFIPSSQPTSPITSPTKRKTIIEQRPNNSSENNNATPLIIPERPLPSTIESYSSNDSDAENRPPPPKAATDNKIKNTTDENADIFNLRQIPNPRRSLTKRSPLKAINILEVVVLPNLKKPTVENDKQTKSYTKQITSQNKSTTRTTTTTTTTTTAAITTATSNKRKTHTNLFGFEEFMDDIDNDNEQIAANNATYTEISDKSHNISEKLKEFGKYRPAEQQQKTTAEIPPLSYVFDEKIKSKQRTVKEMLCSTMISPEKTHKQKKQNYDAVKSNKKADDTSILYKELVDETEIIFNQTDPHRTYQRPVRNRKRKVRFLEDFGMLSDSEDEFDNDDEKSPEKKELPEVKKRKPNERTYNNKKLEQKNLNVEEELSSFVSEFNEMFKEIEQYELLVETATAI